MEAKSNRLKEEMYAWLMNEISRAEQKGVSVRVDGKHYSSDDAEHLYLVMEDGYYMKSYIGDEQGHIIQIDFDHIAEI